MVKEDVVHIDNGILLSDKEEDIGAYARTEMELGSLC